MRVFHPEFYMKDNYPQYEIGEYTYGQPKILDWYDGHTFKCGKFCSFAEGVTILLSGEHRYEWVSTYPFSCNPDFVSLKGTLEQAIARYIRSKGDVVIGNDVWIGHGAMILSGVIIGNGAVVGAGSVVVNNVAPYSIVAGNPAREIKKRFDQPTIDRLVNMKWWDWPIDEIKRQIHLLEATP